VRDGALEIALADGTRYRARIERQYTDAQGQWNVVGRIETTLGPQPMVLTFGAQAVFGLLPMPVGRSLRITTARGGKIEIAPAGSLAPARAAGAEFQSDVVPPPRPSLPAPTLAAAGANKHTEAAQRTRVAGSTTPNAAISMPPASTADIPGTTPVNITVLAVYSADQVTLRGSAAAVKTEIANLFAIANQAHIDSGSRVRLVSVAVQQGDISTTDRNADVLTGASASVLADARNAAGADLVSIVRPHHANDATCGIAYTPGLPQQRTNAISDWGYSVVNVDGDCGPLVFPHEIGHNLGAMHDRATDTSADLVTHGAYWFSFGRRTDAFATIMAYPEWRTWVAYFTSPTNTHCNGPCGIADDADNVRTFNLMAPAIAAYRGTPGTIAFGDIDVLEPGIEPVYMSAEIRLTGKAPAGGIRLQVDRIGGTATAGTDYELPNGNEVMIPEGTSTTNYLVRVLPDALDEPDETIVFRITGPSGTTIADADATYVIARPQRQHLTGSLWFPPNVPRPTTPITMTVEGADGPYSQALLTLMPPDYAFAFDAPYAAQLHLTPQLPDPFAMVPLAINESRQSRAWRLFPEKGVLLSGTVRAAPGMVLPPAPFQIQYYQWSGASFIQTRITGALTVGTDYKFAGRFPPNTDVTLDYDNAAPAPGNSVRFARWRAYNWKLAADVQHDVVLGTLPSVAAFKQERDSQITGGLPIYVSDSAPPGGVSFRCRYVDGTAKAGVDYVATGATVKVPEGQWGFFYCGDLTILRRDAVMPQSLSIVIDQVTGANVATSTAPIPVYGGAGNRLLKTGGRNPPRTR
jgi:hypothetical protein